MYLDSKSNFSELLKTIFQKTDKTIGLLRQLQTLLPRASLIAICKSFIRRHFLYDDMIYDQFFNVSVEQKMKTIQYNAVLAVYLSIYLSIYLSRSYTQYQVCERCISLEANA